MTTVTNQTEFDAFLKHSEMMGKWDADSVLRDAKSLVEAVERLAQNLRSRLDALPEDAELDQILGMGRMLSDEASGNLESRTREARELAASVKALGVRREMLIGLNRLAGDQN